MQKWEMVMYPLVGVSIFLLSYDTARELIYYGQTVGSEKNWGFLTLGVVIGTILMQPKHRQNV